MHMISTKNYILIVKRTIIHDSVYIETQSGYKWYRLFNTLIVEGTDLVGVEKSIPIFLFNGNLLSTIPLLLLVSITGRACVFSMFLLVFHFLTSALLFIIA